MNKTSKNQLHRDLGIFFRNQRIKRGLSQGELADLLDIKTSQFISNVERGVASYPEAYLPKLFKILKIKKEDFLQYYLAAEETRIRNVISKKSSNGDS